MGSHVPGTPPAVDFSRDPVVLGLPLRLSELDTPNSVSSLAWSPAAFEDTSTTERQAQEQDELILGTSNLALSSPYPQPGTAPLPSVNMASNQNREPLRPLRATTPDLSQSGLAVGAQKAFQASKRMQRVLGFQGEAVPYVAPPAMSNSLVAEFFEGLKEYGLDINMQGMGLEGPGDDKRQDWLSSIQEESPTKTEAESLPRAQLNSDAVDDEESIYEGSSSIDGAYDSDSDTKVNVDAPTPRSDARNPTFSFSEALNFGSSDTLVESQDFGAVESGTVNGHSLNASRKFLFARALQYGGKDVRVQAGMSNALPLLPAPVLFPSLPVAPALDGPAFVRAPDPVSNNPPAQSPSRVLFPSPRIELTTRPYVAVAPTPDNQVPTTDGNDFFANLFKRPPPTQAPNIDVSAPAIPTTSSLQRKRASSGSEDNMFGPSLQHSKKLRDEGILGLPSLPHNALAAWKTYFPGLTEGISMTLLTWHSTMRSLYAQSCSPQLLSVHPMFPYPPTKPTNVPLVSISFWDTSTEPHKELRFIGPGDVQEILYAEVDTFAASPTPTPEPAADEFETAVIDGTRFYRKVSRARSAAALKPLRHKDMRDRALVGEGRWCFVVIRGKQKTARETAPYVLLAFPSTAVTHSSECLHTIYPGEAAAPAPPLAPPPQPRLNRISSMPVLHRALRNTSRMHQLLRSASSTRLRGLDVDPNANAQAIPEEEGQGKASETQSQSQQGDQTEQKQTDEKQPKQNYKAKEPTQDPTWTLRRTVLKFQKAGRIPLVEGFRTDMSAWTGWLDAVGKGEGKIMMFCETE
ncbi:hypothetical protein BDV95DRAFT_604606 [Massariosphaeria phaeospora]|uniref:Uncharacterized protein n=1 Tax=Massariosphaeria phaeospora TaxID=100035 RepID=A0A7C8MTB3_9PLEO|nr:hypothetical protein BDV95DRAFT_604606 [Massariosphaeria phaeospora]